MSDPITMLEMQEQESEGGERPPWRSARLLWEQRRFLGRVLLAGLLLSVVYALLAPLRYESTTQVMPPDSQGNNMNALMALMGTPGANGLGGVVGDLLGSKGSSAIFQGVLRSRRIQDNLVNRFDLRKRYGVRTYERARNILRERTTIFDDRKTGLIRLTVADGSAEGARDLARAYVEELDRIVSQVSTSSARRERMFLEQRLETVRVEMNVAARRLSEFSSKNSTIDLKEQGRAMIEAAGTLQGELMAAEAELRGLEQIYTPNNVRVKAVRARITELRRQLSLMAGNSQQGFSTGAGTIPSLRQLPDLAVMYADLYRVAKVQEVVYETLTRQYELAKVQEAKEIPTVRVLDDANVPETRTAPSRRMIVQVGTVLSLLLACAWVLGRDRYQRIDPRHPVRQAAAEIAAFVRHRVPERFSRSMLRWRRGRGTPSA